MIKLIYLDETPSTNNYATRLMETQSAEEGTVVLTFRQTHGRGQVHNRWESADEKNLTFSLILKPGFLPAPSQFFLSQVVSLGVTDYLSSIIDGVTIKWPNDILVGSAKVAGLLIEHTVMGSSIAWTIAGVGLNVNQQQFGQYTPPAVSLSMVTGKTYDLMAVLDAIIPAIMTRYEQLRNGHTGQIHQDYLSRLFRKNEWHYYRADGNTFEARITGTDEYGRLLLCDRQGEVTVWPFKGVEMVW